MKFQYLLLMIFLMSESLFSFKIKTFSFLFVEKMSCGRDSMALDLRSSFLRFVQSLKSPGGTAIIRSCESSISTSPLAPRKKSLGISTLVAADKGLNNRNACSEGTFFAMLGTITLQGLLCEPHVGAEISILSKSEVLENIFSGIPSNGVAEMEKFNRPDNPSKTPDSKVSRFPLAVLVPNFIKFNEVKLLKFLKRLAWNFSRDSPRIFKVLRFC